MMSIPRAIASCPRSCSRFFPPALQRELRAGLRGRAARGADIALDVRMRGRLAAGGTHTRRSALIAPANSPLVDHHARRRHRARGESGVWPLMQASYALDARLALIQNATHLARPAVLPGGRRFDRPADPSRPARRSTHAACACVCWSTISTPPTWIICCSGWRRTPNVEVRLFNPFITVRGSSLYRLIALALATSSGSTTACTTSSSSPTERWRSWVAAIWPTNISCAANSEQLHRLRS